MAETLQEQLERVQSAIAAIESGAQEYSIGGRRVRKADLPVLYEREKDLLTRIDAEQYGTRAYCQWPKR